MLGILLIVFTVAKSEVLDVCDGANEACAAATVETIDVNPISSAVKLLENEAFRYHTNVTLMVSLFEALNHVRRLQHDFGKQQFKSRYGSTEKKLTDLSNFATQRFGIKGLTIEAVQPYGYGVFAAVDFNQNDVLFNISSRNVLSYNVSDTDFACLKTVSSVYASDPQYWEMIGFIVLLLRHKLNETSEFKPYMSSLPFWDIPHPLYFTFDDLLLLNESAVLPGTLRLIQESAAIYAAVWIKLDSDIGCQQKVGVPIDDFTYDSFVWAFVTLLTRNYDGTFKAGERNRVLIPFWDMMNHNDRSNILIRNEYVGPANAEHPVGFYAGYASRPIKRGEQIYLSYLTPLAANEAFNTWGFVHMHTMSIPFRIADLKPKMQKMCQSMTWINGTGLVIHKPSSNQNENRMIQANILADIATIAMGKRNVEITATSVNAAWLMVLYQVDLQLSMYPHEAEYYKKVIAEAVGNKQSKLAAGQVLAEILFLKEIRKNIERKAING